MGKDRQWCGLGSGEAGGRSGGEGTDSQVPAGPSPDRS